MISRRISELAPSPTLSLDAKVKELQASGVDVINLTVGEPDFNTPQNIKTAAIYAIQNNFSKYTITSGIPDLRQAISNKLKTENNLEYSASEIIVSNGAKQVLYNALQVLCDKGDEVLIHTPTWSTYIEQVKLAQGKVKLIKLKPPFKLKASDIEKNLSKKTKIILLNSPCNPTGAIINKEELEKIADLAVKNDIFVISDEIYEKLIYTTERPVSIASVNEEIKNRTITINGVSKSYAMTGWRIGYAAGPKEIIQAMNSLQGQTTSNPSSISQKASVEAIAGAQDQVEFMKNKFKERRDFVVSELMKVKNFELGNPEGAFYLFVSIKEILDKKSMTSNEWCEQLLQEQRVALVPGEAFECPGYFRLSYATSMENLKEALVRINKFIDVNE